MRKTTALAILSIGLLISACSKPTIEGNAFVVKGDGDVKPAAGQTVHLHSSGKRSCSILSRCYGGIRVGHRGS